MAKAGVYQARSRNPDIIAARFWAKVQKGDGCWEWQGSRQQRGYGLFRIKGRLHKAHRAALMVSGVEVPDDLCVLHSCDNPPCCNPAHLRLGTKGENNTERHAKGRTVLPKQCRGEDSVHSKLTEQRVREMRRWRSEGLTYAEIGKRAGISPRHSYDVVNGLYWPSV
jgi:hypothetical protein